METDRIAIEIVAPGHVAVDAGTAALFSADPLRALLELLPSCKAVFLENLALCSPDGVPLLISVVQRGTDPWLTDVAESGVSFAGFRTRGDCGPETHEEALANMVKMVLSIDPKDSLLPGTASKSSLYDFGTPARLTAVDSTGKVIAVAAVKPNGRNRTTFSHSGLRINRHLGDEAAMRPRVDETRVHLKTTLVVPPERQKEMLGLGAKIPALAVRMDAVFDAQTITEPGTALQLNVSGTPVLAVEIPFTAAANVLSNEEAAQPRVHRAVHGNTYGEMMAQTAELHRQTIEANGWFTDESTPNSNPIRRTVSAYALPERARIAVAGQLLSSGAISDDSIWIAEDPEHPSYPDHLRSLGLEVVHKTINDSTDHSFEVTVDPRFVEKKADDPVMVGVGFCDEAGKWVWGDAVSAGTQGARTYLRDLGSDPLKFVVRVPDVVFRRGDEKAASPMIVRLYRGGDGVPLYLGGAGFNMKEFGREVRTLSEAEKIYSLMEMARTSFPPALQIAASAGLVIGEPVSLAEMQDRLASGRSWDFMVGGRGYTVKRAPDDQVQVFSGDEVVAGGVVTMDSQDGSLPSGCFSVRLPGEGDRALYVGAQEVRRAPAQLPAPQDLTGSQAQAARLEALRAVKDGEPVYPNLLWPGITVGNARISTQKDLEALLALLEEERKSAFRRSTNAAADRDRGSKATEAG